MTAGLLKKIDSPDDIKKLNYDALNELAAEIRQYMIEVISKNGGHLAPNLGVVELTLALHKVFNCPKDKIIWDVGHQSYVHKLLTGRGAEFGTLRQMDGMSGFPKRCECASTKGFRVFLKFRKASMTLLAQAIPVHLYRLRSAWQLHAI